MLQRLAFIFVLLIFIPDAYIYWLYIRKWNKAQWVRILWWLPSIILAAGFISAEYIGTQNPLVERQSIIAWLGIFIICIGMPKLFFMLVDLIGRILHAIIKPISVRWFTWLGIILAVGFFCIALYGSTLGLSHFQVKQVTYTSPRLPEGFDGYRIVQISDVHSGSYKDRPDIMEKVVKLTNEQQGDVVFFTGDLVNQRSKEVDQFVDVLSKLHAPDGVYSILGNHDYGRYYRWAQPGDEELNQEHLEKQEFNIGWKLLKNQHDIIYRNNDSIAVIGVENDGNPPFPQYADLPKASEGTEGMFRILLSHDPTHWRREVLPTTDIDLMLAGHTHGTQFMLFGWSPAAWLYDEWGGMYQEGSQALYVSLGIGYVGLPFRFGAWPEITVITLHR